MRVVERTPTSFRFATLDGHLEAGQIDFSARDGELLEFRIESWARAMWTSVIERVAELAGGRLTGGIEIRTRRVE